MSGNVRAVAQKCGRHGDSGYEIGLPERELSANPAKDGCQARVPRAFDCG